MSGTNPASAEKGSSPPLQSRFDSSTDRRDINASILGGCTFYTTMAPYTYTSLPTGSVRLLRLLPNSDRNSRIECQLITFSMLDSGSTHPYEALSYVWGSEDNKKPVYMDVGELYVTANLHAALSHLRHCFVERVLWVDAICINQHAKDEKGRQVQSMAKIYAKASRVIVWLVDPPEKAALKRVAPDKGDPAVDGNQADNGDQALEAIRAAAEEQRVDSKMDQMILTLLQREWFQRIWVSGRRSTIWQSRY